MAFHEVDEVVIIPDSWGSAGIHITDPDQCLPAIIDFLTNNKHMPVEIILKAGNMEICLLKNSQGILFIQEKNS